MKIVKTFLLPYYTSCVRVYKNFQEYYRRRFEKKQKREVRIDYQGLRAHVRGVNDGRY